VHIRLAEERDAAALVRLTNQLMGGPERGISDEGSVLRVVKESNSIPGCALTVAEIDGEVVGTSFLSVLPNLPHNGMPQGHVDNVVVDERYRRRGIGSALMADAVERAKAAGCWGVQLTSRLYRDGAHRFYDDLGFEQDVHGFTLDFTKAGAGATDEPV